MLEWENLSNWVTMKWKNHAIQILNLEGTYSKWEKYSMDHQVSTRVLPKIFIPLCQSPSVMLGGVPLWYFIFFIYQYFVIWSWYNPMCQWHKYSWYDKWVRTVSVLVRFRTKFVVKLVRCQLKNSHLSTISPIQQFFQVLYWCTLIHGKFWY